MFRLARSLHVPTRMSAQRLWIAILSASFGLCAATAQAQGTAGTSGSTTSPGAIAITPISIGDVTASTLGKIYLNKSQCLSNVPVKFQLDNLDPNRSALDVWIGEMCSAMSNRSSTVTTNCRYVTMI